MGIEQDIENDVAKLRELRELYEACPHAPGECDSCDEYLLLCVRLVNTLLDRWDSLTS